MQEQAIGTLGLFKCRRDAIQELDLKRHLLHFHSFVETVFVDPSKVLAACLNRTSYSLMIPFLTRPSLIRQQVWQKKHQLDQISMSLQVGGDLPMNLITLFLFNKMGLNLRCGLAPPLSIFSKTIVRFLTHSLKLLFVRVIFVSNFHFSITNQAKSTTTSTFVNQVKVSPLRFHGKV